MRKKDLYYKITVKDISPIDDYEDIFLEIQAGPYIKEMIKEYVSEKSKELWDLEILNIEEINKDAKKV